MTPQEKPKDPLLGLRLDGRYLITGTLGRGGMGIVYEGIHEQLGRPVAIKVLGAAIASEEVVVKRFMREARIASGLGHGNIVDVSDLGNLPDGRPYLVMPKVDGISFAKLLQRQGPQPPARVAELLRGVASALDLVHAKGLVHRDVKPENLMYVVRADGSETVMLMDFGIATLLSAGARLTAEGVVCGTPAYLAPETARGEDADHRADVYALATVAFELLTGALPFDAENQLRILPMKAFRDPPKLGLIAGRAFPEAVEAVIACGLSREPEARYRSAGEFVDALAHAAQLPAGALAQVPEAQPKLTEPEAVPTIATRPRGPTESLELPLGASDEFALEEAIDGEAAYPAPATDAPPAAGSDRPPQQTQLEQQVTVQSVHPSGELPRSRRAPLAMIGGGVVVAGVIAALWYGDGAGDDPRPMVEAVQPAPSVATVATPPTAPAPEPAPPVEAPAPIAMQPAPDSDTAQPEPEPNPAAAASPSPARKARNARAGAARPTTTTPTAAKPAASTPAPTAEELNRQAAQALLGGHVARAAELYEQATLRDPRNAAAFRGLGLVSERLGRKPAAVRAYQRALELAPVGPQSDTVRERLGKLQ